MNDPAPKAAPPSISVDEALRVAEQLSPLPQRAHEALQVLKAEVLLRWEQRTALSFRLQDLRNAAEAVGIADDSPLYGAIHDATATAEAWMHPGTLSDAAQAHINGLKRTLAESVALLRDLAGTVERTQQVETGPELFKFVSLQDWVNGGQEVWRAHNARGDNCICLDARGRICRSGEDFHVAQADDAYPIVVYRFRKDWKVEGISHG